MGAVRLRPEAHADLLLLASYIGESNWDRANKLVDRLLHRCSLLANTPLMGRSRADLGDGLRSLVQRPYVIFYRVVDKDVDIVAFVHGARDIASFMARRLRGES